MLFFIIIFNLIFYNINIYIYLIIAVHNKECSNIDYYILSIKM